MKRVRYITCFNYQYRNNNFYFEQFSRILFSRAKISNRLPENAEAVYYERSVNNIGFHQGNDNANLIYSRALNSIPSWRTITERNQRKQKLVLRSKIYSYPTFEIYDLREHDKTR